MPFNEFIMNEFSFILLLRYFFYPCLLLLGLVVGSFLNVCIWRLPREESIISPISHCPKCNASIRFYDNIPILSYIILRGHCRACGEGISIRYPFIEAFTALIFIVTGWKFGPSWILLPHLFFVVALIIISFIDIDHYIIPSIITIPGTVIGFLVSFFPFMEVRYLESIIGIVLCVGIFTVIAFAGKLIWKKDALGGGDIELIAMIGAFLGWKGGLMTIFWGSLFGSIWGLILIILKKKAMKDRIPFGPFLCLGAFLTLLFGLKIFWWYQRILTGKI